MEDNYEKSTSSVKKLEPSVRSFVKWRRELVHSLRTKQSMAYAIPYIVDKNDEIMEKFELDNGNSAIVKAENAEKIRMRREFEQSQRTFIGAIIQNISPDVQQLLEQYDLYEGHISEGDARGMWDLVEQAILESKGTPKYLRETQQRWTNMRQELDEPITKFRVRFNETIEEIELMGGTPTEFEKVANFVAALNPRYNQIRTIAKTRDGFMELSLNEAAWNWKKCGGTFVQTYLQRNFPKELLAGDPTIEKGH